MYFNVLLLCACAAYARAMVCMPNYCDSVLCAPVTNCNGVVKAGASVCGCCHTCMAQLGKGDSCWQNVNVGVPATSECGPDLKCDSQTLKCVQKTAEGPCLTRLNQIHASQQNGMPLIGVQAPTCDSTGHYAAVQCIGSVCHCADEMGTMLQTYQDSIGSLANMNCQCARDQAVYMATGLIGKLFYCEDNGNYHRTASVPAGNSVLTNTLAGRQTATGPCAQAKLAQQMSAPILGSPTIECDYDGYYAPRQCAGSQCYCVRKDGTKIGTYSAPIFEKFHLTCQCAHDKDRYDAMGQVGVIHTCMSNGNYQQYQCSGSVCYCVDYNGKMVGNQTVAIGDLSNITC